MNLQIGLSSKTVDLVGVGERFRFKKIPRSPPTQSGINLHYQRA